MLMAKDRIENELMDHDFDGIQEFDNDLPPWWLYLFYFTIAWGILYFLNYHVFKMGDLQLAEYQKEVRLAQENQATRGPAEDTQVFLSPLTDEKSRARGQKIYEANCQACHGDRAQGVVGPNLSDAYWIHGGNFPEILKTIRDGVPAKGMVAWGTLLKADEISEVASYILSLQGTNPAGAKAPEGSQVSQ
jgi:cytochrome c oxidase cbb3-type subunit 3